MAQAAKPLFIRADTLEKLAVVKFVRDENIALGLSKRSVRNECCWFEGQVHMSWKLAKKKKPLHNNTDVRVSIMGLDFWGTALSWVIPKTSIDHVIMKFQFQELTTSIKTAAAPERFLTVRSAGLRALQAGTCTKPHLTAHPCEPLGRAATKAKSLMPQKNIFKWGSRDKYSGNKSTKENFLQCHKCNAENKESHWVRRKLLWGGAFPAETKWCAEARYAENLRQEAARRVGETRTPLKQPCGVARAGTRAVWQQERQSGPEVREL